MNLFFLLVLFTFSLLNGVQNQFTPAIFQLKVERVRIIRGETIEGICACGMIDNNCNVNCPIDIFAQVGEGVGSEFVQERFNPVTGFQNGFETETAQARNFRLLVEVRLSGTDNVMEQWEFPEYSSFPGQVLPMNLVTGRFGNCAITMSLQWICPHHYDHNCRANCGVLSEGAFCDPFTGEPRCQVGFRNPPACPPAACNPNPCLNGSRCTGGPNGFRCICEPPFVGDRCQFRGT